MDGNVIFWSRPTFSVLLCPCAGLCKVLWWACLSVCLSVSLFAYLETHTAELYQISCMSLVVIGPSRTALRYVMHFRYCWWCHAFTQRLYGTSCSGEPKLLRQFQPDFSRQKYQQVYIVGDALEGEVYYDFLGVCFCGLPLQLFVAPNSHYSNVARCCGFILYNRSTINRTSGVWALRNVHIIHLIWTVLWIWCTTWSLSL